MIYVPADQPIISGPSVAIEIDVALSYLATNGFDSSAVVSRVKEAAAEFVTEAATDATLSASDLSAIVAAIPGVAAVVACTIDNAASFTGAGGPSYVEIANNIALVVRTIS
jgi:hypothetical protein